MCLICGSWQALRLQTHADHMLAEELAPLSKSHRREEGGPSVSAGGSAGSQPARFSVLGARRCCRLVGTHTWGPAWWPLRELGGWESPRSPQLSLYGGRRWGGRSDLAGVFGADWRVETRGASNTFQSLLCLV